MLAPIAAPWLDPVITRSAASTYDDDFFAWTQAQAAALRRLPIAAGHDVDMAHVAEEIEDSGKRDLREVASLLARLVEHLIKLAADEASPNRARWGAEASHFQASAASAFSPSMRRVLDVDKVWRNGRRAAGRYLSEAGMPFAMPERCPFTLDQLLDDAFEMDTAVARVAAPPT